MKELIKNIKDTLSQLFGFKEVKEVKEWKQCLEGLEKNGYFTAEQLEAFKEADLTTANLVKSLEDEESKTKGKSDKINLLSKKQIHENFNLNLKIKRERNNQTQRKE